MTKTQFQMRDASIRITVEKGSFGDLSEMKVTFICFKYSLMRKNG